MKKLILALALVTCVSASLLAEDKKADPAKKPCDAKAQSACCEKKASACKASGKSCCGDKETAKLVSPKNK